MKNTFTKDPYFANLTNEEILALAKKSIKLTTQHCEDLHTIEEQREKIDGLESELYIVLDVLANASPAHQRWIDANFKEFIKGYLGEGC